MKEKHTHTPAAGRPLAIAIVLNALIFIVELTGGILTNSLGLISDSLHNLSDFFALILSYIASRVVQWKSNSEKSYGYVRVEIFVAFINATVLVFIGIWVVYGVLTDSYAIILTNVLTLALSGTVLAMKLYNLTSE